MVEVAMVAAEAKDAIRAPALACYGIADLVEGTHVAVAFPATCGHVPVTLDAGGTVTTLEQRLAGTLAALLVAFEGIAAPGIAVARCNRIFPRLDRCWIEERGGNRRILRLIIYFLKRWTILFVSKKMVILR